MRPDLEYHNLLAKGMEEHEAWEKATGIVIHGDELAKIHSAEEALDDNEIEKGRQISTRIQTI